LLTHSISLDRWAGQSVTLTFQVEGDIRNGNSLKCLWRDLYLKSWEDRVRSNFKLLYDGENEINIYENLDALPRVHVTQSAVLSPNAETTFEIMKSGRFDPASEVLLEYHSDDDRLTNLIDSGNYKLIDDTEDKLRRYILEGIIPGEQVVENTRDSAHIESYEMDSVTISATMTRPGFLILSDTFYPGWRATINGQPAKIFRANGFVRAIALDAGMHKVEFRYIPVSFFLGLAISIMTLLVWAIVRIIMRYREKLKSSC
jgi:hypothetical protein